MRRALALLLFLAATAPAAADEPVSWTIAVDISVGPARAAYTAKAWVYSPGPNYRATLYAVGPYAVAAGLGTAVARFDEIIARDPAAAVFNGGFWDDGPFMPAGLLLIGGRATHPFSFQKTDGHDYDLSAVVCLDGKGRLAPLQTQDFVSPTAQIKSQCSSALQAGPIVVQNGANAIRPSEISDNKAPALRTILGFDSSGTPYVVIFQTPVHLFVAAAFLQAPTASIGSARIANARSPGMLQVTSGLGLRNAVNLNGDTSATCYYKGQRIVGNSAQAMPSAFSLQPK